MNYTHLDRDQITSLMEDAGSSSPKVPVRKLRKLTSLLCRQYLDLYDRIDRFIKMHSDDMR